MKYTIEDLRNGKCAVKNDGTVEELKKVLRLAFPSDNSVIEGAHKYYYSSSHEGEWMGSSYPRNDLPVQSVKNFLDRREDFKHGDEVEAFLHGRWIKCKYASKCINNPDRSVVFYPKQKIYLSLVIRPLKTELTRSQIAEKFGIDVDKLVIKD